MSRFEEEKDREAGDIQERAGRPRAKRPGPRSNGQGRPAGKPAGKPLGKPAGKPLGKPLGKPAGKPLGKPVGKPLGKPPGKPLGKPAGRPAAKLPVRRPSEAIPAPRLDPLAAAKLTWQPTLRWCQKELREVRLMDPRVQAAVEQFQALVRAVLASPAAGRFLEAQEAAVAFVSQHPFLRWAPVPAPLPKVQAQTPTSAE